jgi:DIRP
MLWSDVCHFESCIVSHHLAPCIRCNFNPFAADAQRAGIPADAMLTMREWQVVRRRLQHRPRRFSRQFIVSQLNSRNEYRSNVRLLQNNPHLATKARLPYNIYCPIRVGAMVTAYNKRFRIIQRGRVLTYDRSTALYLIDFENKNFGFELCPDSDVATCGPPDILVRSNLNTLLGNPIGGLDMPLSGSATGPVPGKHVLA